MLATTNVKFRLFGANGNPVPAAVITARLTRQDTDGGAVCKVFSVQGVSDDAGECIIALWPNARGTTGSQYSVSISISYAIVDEYTITVPESGSTVLVESIKSAAPYPTASAAQQALEAAQQAVVDAADASRLTIGTVTTLDTGASATATITGDAGAQELNLGLPRGPAGTGGSGGGATNLAYTASPTGGTVTSDTGTDATIPLADGTNAGLMTPAEKSKLAATSGTNTGDQDLSGYSLTGHTHSGVYDPAGTAASAVAAHAGTGGTAHANAIASGAAGFMTGADKTKLDGIAAGAQVNPASTDALSEGSTNLYHTASRVLGQVLTGLSTAAGTVVEATHTILQAIGFLQKQVSDNTSALTGKAATGAVGSSGLTMATTKLLGRSTAGTGAVEEITLGTNLSFTGTTLNAAGGGGGGGERRHAFAAPYSYNGTATAGTADSASGWTVTRITVAANGTTTVATATGAWTDRASLTYV